MKLAINTQPLISGHRIRGIGSYTRNLIDNLLKINELELTQFEDPNNPPEADVVHYPYFDLFAKTLPPKSKNPRIVTIHDVIPLVFPNYFPAGVKGYLNLFFQKRSLKNINTVIADSRTSKNDIASKLSYPKEKIKAIYLAPRENFKRITNTKKIADRAKKYNLPKNFALYVGDVNWNKNIENLIRAVKIAKLDLVMVGSAIIDNQLSETIKINKLIKNLDMGDQIHKLGYVDEQDLICLYNLAQLTLLPSFYEGFGLPVLESMACGTPVVCSKVASLAEIGGDAAIYCDPSNPDDIAAKISQVLNLTSAQLGQLSEKSIANASNYSWEKTAKQTFEVYQSLL